MKSETNTAGIRIRKGKVIYTDIRIHAPLEQVWETFIDFKSYPGWNPFIRSLEGPLVPGSQLKVHLQPRGQKGMTFTPELLVNGEGREFRWIGKLLIPGLFDGEHVFQLRDNGDGTTTFVQFERFRGILVPFLAKMLDGATRQGFMDMNQALKDKCEKRS